jgi:hypothetical protein
MSQMTPNEFRAQADAQTAEAEKTIKAMRDMVANGADREGEDIKAMSFLIFQRDALARSLREVATRMELVANATTEADRAIDEATGGLLGRIFG